MEFGKKNTVFLTLIVSFCYIVAFIEGWIRETKITNFSVFSLCLYSISIVFLVIVIKTLGKIWTIKLIILPNQKIIKNSLYRTIRHPNYFFNLLPEVLAIILLYQAWIFLAFSYPLFVFSIIIRIIQEEKIMREKCSSYK